MSPLEALSVQGSRRTTAPHDVRAARCAQAGSNPLRAPACPASPAAGDMTAKTFHSMTRDLWGNNMAVQPVEHNAQQPLGDDIIDKEPASCRSGHSEQDGARPADYHAPADRLAHASPSNRAALRQSVIGDMTAQVARGMSEDNSENSVQPVGNMRRNVRASKTRPGRCRRRHCCYCCLCLLKWCQRFYRAPRCASCSDAHLEPCWCCSIVVFCRVAQTVIPCGGD